MTREEAQKILKIWMASGKSADGQRGYIEGWFDKDDVEAFRMAIEALAERPTVDKEYLIDLIQESVYDGEACAKLIDLVDRPTGEWVKALDGCERHVKCTHCFKTYWQSEAKQYNYCPNCGAVMKGGEDE